MPSEPPAVGPARRHRVRDAAAAQLGLEVKIGKINPVAFADLTAVAGDPTKDVEIVVCVLFVLKGGRVGKGENPLRN